MTTSARDHVRRSHARLAATLETLTDADARRPSLLPGWTVGHVLTHLARNADSLVRLLEGGARGEVADQYAGGNERRAAAIEAGGGRPSAELVADVLTSAARLEATWDATPDGVWRTGQGRVVSGVWPLADLPFRRWREVEIHHVDLGLAYGFRDWPDEYVDAELDRTLAELPGRLPPGTDIELVPPSDALLRRRFLAWLIGRAEPPAPGYPSLGPW